MAVRLDRCLVTVVSTRNNNNKKGHLGIFVLQNTIFSKTKHKTKEQDKVATKTMNLKG